MNGMLTLLDAVLGFARAGTDGYFKVPQNDISLARKLRAIAAVTHRGTSPGNSPANFERKGEPTMNSLILLSNTMKEGEIADRQSNQPPAPAPKLKVLPKKEIPRLPKTQIEPKRVPVPVGKAPER
jgi:hypothetical protein